MSKHGNSYTNEEEHHVYEIIDSERSDVFKYGICAKPLEPDGSSARGNEQANFLNNAVGWFRFLARVVMAGIYGRRKAREAEHELVENYKKENGHYPPGNKDHKKFRG